ncbi:MAG: hypothetical protein AB7O96_01500 [Pseudobdellovibrionaceae bacterium]
MKNHSILFAYLVLFSAPAHAYLDPGSGSMIGQIIIGGIVSAFVFFKMYWHRLLGWINRKKPSPKSKDGTPTQANQ